MIETGKGNAFLILIESAASNSQLNRFSPARGQIFVGFADDDIQILGQRCILDQASDFGTDGIETVMPVLLGALNATLDFGFQIIMVQETVKRPGGNHKTVRDPDVQAARHLAETGHLHAGLIGMGFIQV